jgi:CheY-like chemotaxis protein
VEEVRMATPDTNTILLIEDNTADTYLVQRAVADCGPDLRLWIMPDGPEALMFLRKEPPLEAVPTPICAKRSANS